MGYIDPWLDVKGVGLVLNIHLDRKISNDMAKELRKCVFKDTRNVRVLLRRT